MESHLFWTYRLRDLSDIKEEYQKHKCTISQPNFLLRSRRKPANKCTAFSGEDFSEKDFDELYNHVCEAEKLIKRLIISELKLK